MPGVKSQLFTAATLTETDTFTTRVYPRNEFVQTDRIKTIRTAVTAPPPARVDRVSQLDFSSLWLVASEIRNRS